VNPPNKSVVLVDDDKLYADLMIEMIAMSLDCKVHAFTRPLDALEALSSVDPSVVVTDYNMPDLNGLEFIRQASPLVPKANFVLMTGHDLSAFKDEMDRLGALKGFLAKPFGSRKLADEIKRVWPNKGALPATDATSV
jgi:DNA-binding NtrC family response regulator